jgi:hypothetical protein
MKTRSTYDYCICLRHDDWSDPGVHFRELLTLDTPGFWERQGIATTQYTTLEEIPIWTHKTYISFSPRIQGDSVDHV